MATIAVKLSHLSILNALLLLNVVAAHVIVPLCGSMDGSPPKDSDKIYFKDRTQGIRTVEINGTIYACYPDGTMVDTGGSKSSESGESVDDTTLHTRIQTGKYPITIFNFKILISFLLKLTLIMHALSLFPPLPHSSFSLFQ